MIHKHLSQWQMWVVCFYFILFLSPELVPESLLHIYYTAYTSTIASSQYFVTFHSFIIFLVATTHLHALPLMLMQFLQYILCFVTNDNDDDGDEDDELNIDCRRNVAYTKEKEWCCNMIYEFEEELSLFAQCPRKKSICKLMTTRCTSLNHWTIMNEPQSNGTMNFFIHFSPRGNASKWRNSSFIKEKLMFHTSLRSNCKKFRNNLYYVYQYFSSENKEYCNTRAILCLL